MPNTLIISLEAMSASSRQMYPQLFSKVLSRTAVHESITLEDAFNYIGAGWPNIIFLSEPSIAQDPKYNALLKAIIEWVKHGCTLMMIGFFCSTIEFDNLDKLFKQALGLKWRVTEHSSHQAQLSHSFDENMIRQTSLVPAFDAKAVWLGHVPAHEAVYTAASSNLAYAAFARIGLGKVGYVGDVNFGEEPERLIIAMCHLDREEDRFEASLDAI